MAASNLSVGGFSYAQAAKGKVSAIASQTSSSKATSGAASPVNGLLSEPLSKTNWADDVEASTAAKLDALPKPQHEDPPKSIPADEHSPTQAKSEDKLVNGASTTSSPDLVATPSTAASTAPKDDDLQSAVNATSSSESAWEARSQASEPAWIAERKERQSKSESREQSAPAETETEGSDSQPPEKTFILQEAAPPPVNPWLKRAEDAKARTSAISRPTPAPVPTAAPAVKQNTGPRAESRRKANLVAPISAETPSSDVKKPSDARNSGRDELSTMGPPPKPVSSATPVNGTSSTSTRSGPSFGRQSLPTLNTVPPSVSDEASWPTPDTLVEKDRKDGVERDAEDKQNEDGTTGAKSKKREWKVLPVTPNFLFQTSGMNEPKGRPPRAAVNGERGGKGGPGGRGRGGHRGALHGAGGDRHSARVSASPTKQESESSVEPLSRSAESEKPTTVKSTRAPSAASLGRSRSDMPNGVAGTVATAEVKPTDEGIDGEKGIASPAGESGAAKDSHNLKTTTDINGDNVDHTDDDLPKPIPRRNSLTSQAQTFAPSNPTSRQTSAVPPRSAPDGRKESRTSDSSREPWSANRPAKRGGRGRGGAGLRETPNGHQGNGPYQGSFGSDLGSAYGLQASPYQMPRGHHPYAYPVNGRGGWSNRGGLRSQSIPIENTFYQQRMGYFPNGAPHIAPIDPYMANMYDAHSVPMSPYPFGTMDGAPYLIDLVITQLEYYFSVDNLLKDMFLRKHMDSQGFVLLDVIANFNRVKSLCYDREALKVACVTSEVIEICVGEDGRERLRRADGWQQFLLPTEQRDLNAQNDGPEQLRQLDRSQLPYLPQRGMPPAIIPPSRPSRMSYDSAYSMFNGVPAHYSPYGGMPSDAFYVDGTNGEEMRGRSARSPTHESPMSPIDQATDVATVEITNEPDAFLDSQVDVLTLVVKMSPQSLPSYHSLSSRTFSNGSIDSRTIKAESDKAVDVCTSPKKDETQTAVNGNEMHLPSVPRRASPNKPRSVEPSQKEAAAREVFWVKDQEGPVPDLPAGLNSEPYVQLRTKALDQRNHAATGNCPYDMDVLYQFWCHFLIRNFNHRMYTEFKTYAHEDAKRTNYTGIQNLVKFYAQSLSSPSPIRDLVVRDYVDLVRNEPTALQGSAFKQLRSAWRNGALNLKNRKKLADIVDDKMKEQMDRPDA